MVLESDVSPVCLLNLTVQWLDKDLKYAPFNLCLARHVLSDSGVSCAFILYFCIDLEQCTLFSFQYLLVGMYLACTSIFCTIFFSYLLSPSIFKT